MQFIFTFDAIAKDALAEQGYALLYTNGVESRPMWVFHNPSGTEPEMDGLPYALSDTMIF